MTAYYHPGGRNDDGVIETPFITGRVSFLIRCQVCHTGLCKKLTIVKTPRRRQNLIFVEPCPRCLEAAKAGRAVEVIELDDLDREVDRR